jgi:hypothetical protein
VCFSTLTLTWIFITLLMRPLWLSVRSRERIYRHAPTCIMIHHDFYHNAPRLIIHWSLHLSYIQHLHFITCLGSYMQMCHIIMHIKAWTYLISWLHSSPSFMLVLSWFQHCKVRTFEQVFHCRCNSSCTCSGIPTWFLLGVVTRVTHSDPCKEEPSNWC